ncbi:ACT domain-containing protein [Rhodopirellula sp. P2]|uniref:ACT domain-containing protein n=1 Tax=Rhodopirellula sp. P2 TaxID=2127060 RepID=UPI0023683B3B|nr:ACT domain-containing protein [Rhodopirellula sp. P2]WDQ15272.1 ACT domain-containing protein [Rhodopirellula sp. P2]
MTGITDLPTLLGSLRPLLREHEFVFVTQPGKRIADAADLRPIAAFEEQEGLTLVLRREHADANGEHYQGVFRMITLQVHSSLEAVGLTAAVAEALSEQGISANVMAAFFHDHVFVPSDRAHDAMATLEGLRSRN